MRIPENKALTGIRGLAALCVFVSHTVETLGTRGLHVDMPNAVRAMLLNGGKWVDVFFVLSGFVLAMVYREWFSGGVSQQAYFTFMRRRWARIYPLHLVMLLAAIAMVIAAQGLGVQVNGSLARYETSQLPFTFTLTHAWGFLPGFGDWNPPSWSISIELLAYLVLPWILLATCHWSRTRPWLLLCMALAVGTICNLLTPWENSGAAGIARGLSEFFLGCMAFNLKNSDAARWLQSPLGSTLALAAMLIGFALIPPTGFAMAALTVPVLWALSARNPASAFFSWRPVFFLGEISYSIYLGHFVFSTISYRIISVAWMQSGFIPALLGFAFITGFVLLLSTCTYYLIEKPGRQLLDGRRPPHTTAPVALQAVKE